MIVVNLIDSVVTLLDLADENLGCSALIFTLDRTSNNLGVVLHSIMYVGGTVVTKPRYKLDSGIVLVQLDI